MTLTKDLARALSGNGADVRRQSHAVRTDGHYL